MAYEFKLPDLGEGLTEGEVARWLVREGQEIGEDDPLVEIQTDKTTVEIPSPTRGTVSRILVQEGELVAVGTVLVVIGDAEAGARDDERPSARSAVAGTVPGSKGTRAEPIRETRDGSPVGTATIRATPLVRRLALVPEPENPHDPAAVAIWDEGRRLQAGYVPADVAPRVAADAQALALWEFCDEGGRRVGLRVLIAPPGAWIGAPR